MQKHEGNTTFWTLTLQIELTLLCTLNRTIILVSSSFFLNFSPLRVSHHANCMEEYHFKIEYVVSQLYMETIVPSVESCAPNNFLMYIMHDSVRSL